MNLKEGELYRKLFQKIPSGTIIASPVPFELGRVLNLSGFRYKVVRKLTNKEFQIQHLENMKDADHAMGQAKWKEGSSNLEPTDENQFEPEPDQKYYYALEIIR